MGKADTFDEISATIAVTLPAAIVGIFPVKPILKMAFFQPVVPMESIMACLVFRQILLQRLQPDCVESFSMVMTTITPHTAEGLDLGSPV